MATEDKHAKTEPPTPKRKKEARDRGQVARSPDVSGWASVLLGAYLLPWVFSNTEHRVLGLFGQASHVMSNPTTTGAFAVLSAGLRIVAIVIVPIGAIFAVLAFVVNVAQVGRSFSMKAAKPRLSRISPKNGIKHLVGAQLLIQLLKQILKLLVLGGAGYQVVNALVRSVGGTSPVGLVPILGATASSILGFVRTMALIGLVIGIGDFAFQRRKLKSSLKMTKQEVKEEAKASEGNPQVKAEIRKRQYAMARSRVASAMRTADVVITNPTHFAVALQYLPGAGAAPRVVAKGSDSLAKMIRERAVEGEIPIVEDAPLARYLYAVCEVDQQIPAEIYVAVAKLLAFVYSLPAATRALRVHQGLPSQLPEVLAAVDSLAPGKRQRARAVLAAVGT